MEIIPAIDLIDGKCVRLTQGDYNQKKIYNENPLEVAKEMEGAGIKRLHLVDLDGAKKGEVINYKVLYQLAAKTNLIIDFGGGITSNEMIQRVFNEGADIATIGSIAVKNEGLFGEWIKKYGSEKILLGADVRDKKITISGWLEKTSISIFDFIDKNSSKGIKNIFCTDVAMDGLLQGTSIELYKEILAKFPKVNLIASGGVTRIDDLELLKETGCSGAIIGKALYEGRIKLNELKNFM
jgi:phosphoribosylformimino-5-aminoimidazole carboxamide ribotide isomerase